MYLTPLHSCNHASTGVALQADTDKFQCSSALHVWRLQKPFPRRVVQPCAKRSAKKGLRERNSPKCTLSQNGYGELSPHVLIFEIKMGSTTSIPFPFGRIM